jgi:hypothetical protein
MRGCQPSAVNFETSSKFPWGAIRLRTVVDKLTLEANGIGNDLSKFGNRQSSPVPILIQRKNCSTVT